MSDPEIRYTSTHSSSTALTIATVDMGTDSAESERETTPRNSTHSLSDHVTTLPIQVMRDLADLHASGSLTTDSRGTLSLNIDRILAGIATNTAEGAPSSPLTTSSDVHESSHEPLNLFDVMYPSHPPPSPGALDKGAFDRRLYLSKNRMSRRQRDRESSEDRHDPMTTRLPKRRKNISHDDEPEDRPHIVLHESDSTADHPLINGRDERLSVTIPGPALTRSQVQPDTLQQPPTTESDDNDLPKRPKIRMTRLRSRRGARDVSSSPIQPTSPSPVEDHGTVHATPPTNLLKATIVDTPSPMTMVPTRTLSSVVDLRPPRTRSQRLAGQDPPDSAQEPTDGRIPMPPTASDVDVHPSANSLSMMGFKTPSPAASESAPNTPDWHTDTPSKTTSRRSLPASLRPDPASSVTDRISRLHEEARALHQSTRASSSTSNSIHDRPPVATGGESYVGRRRTPLRWTQDEEEALERGMREFGTQWASILHKYGRFGTDTNALARFHQIQLKDKARNIKQQRKRAGKSLGPFEQATNYPY